MILLYYYYYYAIAIMYYDITYSNPFEYPKNKWIFRLIFSMRERHKNKKQYTIDF